MNSTWDKFTHALSIAKTIDDIEYIISKIQTTSLINRKTIEGRELTKKLLTTAYAKMYDYEPF